VVKQLPSGIRSIGTDKHKYTHKRNKRKLARLPRSCCVLPNFPLNSNRRCPKAFNSAVRFSMPLISWNLLGRVLFHGMVKIIWCEVRWIRWLAELHQSAYTWNCWKRLGADLHLFLSSRILFRPSLGGLWSPVHEQWQLFPNFEQLTSATVWPSWRFSRPPPPQVLSPSENTLTSHGLICTNTFTDFVFCSSFHDLQTVYFRSMTALKDAS